MDFLIKYVLPDGLSILSILGSYILLSLWISHSRLQMGQPNPSGLSCFNVCSGCIGHFILLYSLFFYHSIVTAFTSENLSFTASRSSRDLPCRFKRKMSASRTSFHSSLPPSLRMKVTHQDLFFPLLL